MARSRNIKPALFKNELLGEADPLVTILFTGLWCLADKEGRLEDRPRRIRVEILPYRDNVDVDEMLDWLENNSFINRYQVDDGSYIQICKFHIHQSPHHMELESVIPAPVGEENKFKAKPLYKKQKERILSRDGNKCKQCGATKKLHIDHIVPVSKGGTSDDDNLQVLCVSCNCSKGNKIVNDSTTNRERIVETASCPTDSFNLIPDSLNLIPDSGLPDINPTAKSKISPCPVEQIIGLYESTCTILPRLRVIPDKTKTAISSRWRQDAKFQSLEFWRGFFDYCNNNRFLSGQADPRPGSQKPFRADLNWIVKPEPFANIINEKYE